MSAMNARASTAVRTMPGTLGACARRAGSRPRARGARARPPRPAARRPARAPLPHGARARTACSSGTRSGTRATTRSLGYSLLYYFPAALVGNDLVALVSVVAAAALFASLAEREWGEAARWPARVFAVVACGPLFTGTYPYAAGLAAGLGALKALQLGRPWTAVALAALTLGLSPLAFLFLCLAVVAAFLARAAALRPGRRSAWASALLALGLFQGALLLVYPEEAEYPFFRLEELLTVLVLSGLCGALALASRARAHARRALRALDAGHRGRVRSSPRRSARTSRGCAGSSSRSRSSPPRSPPTGRAGSPASRSPRRSPTRSSPTWAPRSTAATRAPRRRPSGSRRLDFLAERWSPDYRVEVVPTGDHWEAYWLPARRLPARARLVPAARHRPEPALLRGAARAGGLPRVARRPRRPLGAPAATRSSAGSGRSARPSSCARAAPGSRRSAARGTSPSTRCRTRRRS